MHLIRRAAFRAASSPSTSFISKQRSITTSSAFALRSKIQSGIAPSVFRRFASDEATSSESEKSGVESADGEHGSVSEAIESATESASSYASDASESVSSNAEAAKDTIVNAAAGAAAAAGIAYQPREDRRESRPSYGGDRDGGRERRPYNDRNDRGGDRGADRSGGRDYRAREPRTIEPSAGIYIGNLVFDITPADLQREFESFGTIRKVTLATDERGMSKGFAYVVFESVEEATAAIKAKHQSVLDGRTMVVNYQAAPKSNNFSRDAQNPPSKTLFIGNLAFEMSDSDLNNLFRDVRNVIDVRVAIDRRTGQPRGFAHADFVDTESAVKAREDLLGKEVYGRTLRIDFSAGAAKPFNNDRGDRGGRDGRRGGDDRRGGDRY